MHVLTRMFAARDVAVGLIAMACFIALGMIMPDLTPHRLDMPLHDEESAALPERLVAEKTIGTLSAGDASLRIVDDYILVGGFAFESTPGTPDACGRRCLADDKCTGFVLSKAGVGGSPQPLCHLAAGPVQFIPNVCCVSGIVRNRPRQSDAVR